MSLSFQAAWPAANQVFQRDPGFGINGARASIKFVDSGSGHAVVGRVKRPDGTVVFNWTSIASNTTAGDNVGVMWLPLGGPYFIDIAISGDTGNFITTANEVYCGVNVLAIGQSNMENMWLVSSSSPPTPNALTFLSRYNNWSQSNQGWSLFGTPIGDGAITLLNALQSSFGCPVHMVAAAKGDTSLSPVGAHFGGGWWLDNLAEPNVYSAALALLAQTGGMSCECVLFDQGENDAIGGGVVPDAYWQGLRRLFNNLRSATGDPTLPIFVVPTGYSGSRDAALVSKVRKAQRRLIADMPFVYRAAERYDLSRADANHQDAPGYARLAERLAASIGRTLGIRDDGGLGPTIIGATKSGTTVTVTIDIPPGATVVAATASGNPSSFEFSADNFATLLTPSGFSISGRELVFTFSATMPTKGRFYYGNPCDSGVGDPPLNVILRDNWADGAVGRALCPCDPFEILDAA